MATACPRTARTLKNGRCLDTTTKKFVRAVSTNASRNSSANALVAASRNAAKNAAPKNAAPKKSKSKKSPAKRKDSLSVSCGCTPARPKLSTGKKRKSKKGGK